MTPDMMGKVTVSWSKRKDEATDRRGKTITEDTVLCVTGGFGVFAARNFRTIVYELP